MSHQYTPMPRVVALGRARACRGCPTPCAAYTAGELAHGDESAGCPLPEPRWRPWLEVLARQHARSFGLGDAVAVVAKPIARGVDAVTRGTPLATDLQHCGGCRQRQEGLNRAGRKAAKALKAATDKLRGR